MIHKQPSLGWPACAALALVCPAATSQQALPASAQALPPGARQIAGVHYVELAARALPAAPWAERVDAFWEGSSLSLALDEAQIARLAGLQVDCYVVDHKDDAQWLANRALVDLRGGPSTHLVQAGFAANVVELDPGNIFGGDGERLSRGLDIVVDVDRDGTLSSGDCIDGAGRAPGAGLLKTAPLNGPYQVVEQIYSAGTWLGQDVYYPANIAQLGPRPLVVVSHGNGHNYQWYDHIGFHLASWGCIVMSHTNNTVPGIVSASTTTLSNTEYLLANQATVLGGVLAGKIDRTRIAWIGHSRGGEGVAHAHNRIRTGAYAPVNFQLSDIKLVSSIAPTDFLGPTSSLALGVAYSLWTGGADADVNGCADCDLCQTFQLHERANFERYSISLHGAGHGAFHNGSASTVATGPCQLSRTDTHLVMKAYFLPMVKHHLFGEPIVEECLWRHWNGFRGFSLPSTPCLVVDLMFRPPASRRLVVDDFQTNPATNLTSSDTSLVATVTGLVEGVFNDNDTVFTDLAGDPMNGMTLAGPGDVSAGIVFDSAPGQRLSFELPAAGRDLRRYTHVSLRAAQATRDPLTTAVLGEHDMEVALLDGAGRRAVVRASALSMGISEPYQRTACGTGTGWANEFETIRVDLEALLRSEPAFDATDARSIELEFVSNGRIGLDEVALEVDP